jgi:hypothetical protein
MKFGKVVKILGVINDNVIILLFDKLKFLMYFHLES